MIAPPILHKDDYSIRIAASAAESAAAGDLPVKLAAAPGAPCDVQGRRRNLRAAVRRRSCHHIATDMICVAYSISAIDQARSTQPDHTTTLYIQ